MARAVPAEYNLGPMVGMNPNEYPLIAGITNPLEIQEYDQRKLKALGEEARAFLIESIGRTGGHLGAALGVVELTIALFNQFDFLRDRIAWDVGHQAHVHKLLTGRAPLFSKYGLWGGMCKFLERPESPYDHMGAGHASTSISAALGMAIARDRLQQDHHVVAVIGDGAMTGGLAYEALNAAGALDLDLIAILNDNGMSIDENVGAFTRTLTRITSSDSYNVLRKELKRVTGRVPFGSEILKSLKHFERAVKDYGFKAAHMYPHWFGVRINDRRMYPIFEKCAELDIPICFQTGQGTMRSNSRVVARPIWIDEIVRDFPTLKIVALHSGYPWEDELVALAIANEHVYICPDVPPPRFWHSTILAYMKEEGRFAGLGGSDKVVWATDFPLQEPEPSVGEVDALGLKPEIRRKLLRDNAIRIFKLDGA